MSTAREVRGDPYVGLPIAVALMPVTLYVSAHEERLEFPAAEFHNNIFRFESLRLNLKTAPDILTALPRKYV